MNNILYCGDNLEILKKKIKDESIDLIYIDPPFFSNKKYEVVWGDEAEIRSFEDRWKGGIDVYVDWMRERVEELYRVLKPTGSFYLHCDWHAGHYLKVMCDDVFGKNKFQNEIIWHFPSMSAAKKHFPKKHHTIFTYIKSNEYIFNCDEVRVPYSKGTIERARYGSAGFGGKNSKANYLNKKGKIKDDVWMIPHLKGNERTGYPTQKPRALLERIILASSNRGDIVLDAFCGCGTTMEAAYKLKRKWIGIDISPTAIKLIERRLKEKVKAIKDEDYISIGLPTTIKDLKLLKPFEFQNWVVAELGGKASKKKTGDKGIDGYLDKDLFHDRIGIQVKQSEGVGRNVVDNFETSLKRGKFKNGFVVGFSFTRGANEEVIRAKNEENLGIRLITVEDLLNKKILLR